jgi:porin
LQIQDISKRILFGGLCLLLAYRAALADDPPTSATREVTPATTESVPEPVTEGITGDWFGLRTKLADAGFTVGGAVDFDYSRNFQGGVSTSKSASREITNLNFTLTSDQALGWQGGTFFFNFQNHEGENGTSRLSGDAQSFDNQDGPNAVQLSQAWFQQTFEDDKWRIKIGRVDANSEFDYVSNGTQFLNSSFGYSPAVFAFPTYPDPAISANIFWTPCDYFYLGAGVYDSNRSERSLIFAGHPQDLKPSSGGVFSIVEAGSKWNLATVDLPGRLGIGGYYHNGQFPRFDGNVQDGAAGMYAVLDQTIWRPSTCKDGCNAGIGVFAGYAFANSNVSLIDQQAGAGMAWTGPLQISSREADILGVAATYAHLSSHASLPDDYELTVEAFYKIQLTSWFDIQPDLQYIIHPGGNGTPDALVGTIRAEIDF